MAAAILLLPACRQDMHDQAKVEPLEASRFFADGQAARLPVPGTVARGELREDGVRFTGFEADGNWTGEVPLALDAALLRRGRQRYEIYCSPCHGRLGDGSGIVVQRGFKKPPSFHQERLRAARPGYYFDVITNGFATMSSYASQVPVDDRWAITAYVRALQLSQQAPRSLLDAGDREALTGSRRVASPRQEESHE